MEWMTDPSTWIALGTLTVLEIILGIDNVIFIAILAGKLPPAQQPRARFMGLSVAMLTRIALLFAITWMMRLVEPLFTVFGHVVTGRDLILIAGGLFLLAKATHEIHDKLEGEAKHTAVRPGASFVGVLAQIAVIDIVFSLDSVITAVGMADNVAVMVAAIVIAVGVMMVSAGAIAGFVEHHPTVKMLALSFLLLIGMALVADGFGQHIPKGYMYFAMCFSVFVELLNLRMRTKKKKTPPAHLRRRSVSPS